MDFKSPLTFESEPSFSVIAEDLAERDITLNNAGTPQPVLASTAQKDRSNRDLIQRIQNLSEMAGSYMEVENNDENHRNTDQNFQFLDFLQKNSSISNQTTDQSLGILDLEGMRDADESASLVHVDSNASMGSWLAEFLPEQARGKASLCKQDDVGAEGMETINPSNERSIREEYSRLASRFLMSESQLPSSDQDSMAQGIHTYFSSVENSLQDTPYKSNRSELDETYRRETSQQSTFTEEEPYEQYSAHGEEGLRPKEKGKEACGMLNFSCAEFQDAYSLQQKIFSSEEFTGNIEEVLEKDEEIFVEENKLLMNSGEEVHDVTEMGFSLVADSPDSDPKLSIGAYIAARSEKMGGFGQESFGIERPSFGMKIRTPSPRKPHPLLRAQPVQETYIVEDIDNEIMDPDAATEDSRSSSCTNAGHGSVLMKDQNAEKTAISSDENSDLNDNDISQDVTIDPSMLSLSEAIMNMSTNVNNEELAKAIIEISKKKKEGRMKKKDDRKILKEKNRENPKADRNSGIPMQSEKNSNSKRESKIPCSKSTSPRKSVRMSYSKTQQPPADRKSLSQRQQSLTNVQKKRESVNAPGQKSKPRSSEISNKSAVNDKGGAAQASGIGTKKAPFEKPVRKAIKQERSKLSIENVTDHKVDGRNENKENCKDVSSSNIIKNMAGKNMPETSQYTAPTFSGNNGFEGVKKKNPILLESFMEDTPVHDGDVIGSPNVVANEELQSFNNGRESVCFPDECLTKYLLSSTRSDLSLTRGSLSRESIEELHKKLRVRGPRVPEKVISSDLPHSASSEMPCASEVDRLPSESIEAACKKILEEDKMEDADGHPLSQSSPDRQSSRFSGEFYQMLPSMSFAEMATIQEHDFNPKDLEDDTACMKSVVKLDAIQEEAETTQDTTISNQSTASGDSQVPPSEITQDQNLTHQTQHSLSHVPSMMHHPQHLYPPMQHVVYRHPSSYPPEMQYRSVEAPYHMPVVSQDYMGRGHPHMYPNHYNYMSNYSHHPMMHSTTSIGYPVEQSSMASSADVALNHTTGTVYPHASFPHPGMVPGPRSASVDGRFHSFPETYFHQSRRPQSVMEASITLPAELLFPGVRCVSLQSHAKLPLVNKTDRWLQVEMNIVSPAFDCCFSLDSKPLVGPHDTKNIDVSFAAKTEGQFEALVEVISYPVTSEGTMLQSARSTPSMITIKATADIAKAELRGPDDKHEIDFKETICESSKYLPLKLVNKGSAEVPVCVVLCSKSQDRQCFALAESSVFEWSDDDKKARTILRMVMPSNDRVTTIWVHCRIPSKHCTAAEPPKNISAQIYMEVDNTYQKHSMDNVLLDSLPVEVTACVAKLHAPKNMQPLTFLCSKEDYQVHSLPVKNCGNIQSRVSFSIAEHNDVISVSPSHAALAAGEHVSLSVKFQPGRSTPNRLDATLIMAIEPNATKYEVLIVAESTEARTDFRHSMSSRGLSSRSLDTETVPSLLTNKSHLCWGGVAVGKSIQQRVVLRTSPGATKPLPMRVMIKGDDSSCFQILYEDDKEREELCSKLEMSMRPGQDKVIRILFAPTKCRMILAKLEIKAPFDQVPSTKFTIPLSGYGGRCEMKLELEKSQSDSDSSVDQYTACFDNLPSLASTDPQRRQTPKIRFAVKNSSSRDAFVKAVFYSDKECITQMRDGILACNPSQLVLSKRSSQTVTLTLQKDSLSTSERSGYSRNGRDFIGCICIWYGEEIARCLLKASLAKLGPSAISKTLSDCNPLRSVPFDGIFEGEGSKLKDDVSQVKAQLGDVQTFYAGLQKAVVHVFGPVNEKPLFHKVDGGKSLASASIFRQTNPVKDVPRNDTHQFLFSSKADSVDDSWEVSPEHVILAAPRTNSTCPPSKIKIWNRSSSILRFDVAWSGHYLTITPHSGVVDPESALVILISPNPSLASRRDLLPWLGTIQVSSKDGRSPKQIRIQIRDNVGNLDASVQPATPRLPLKAQYNEIPSNDSFATPLSSSGRTSSARTDSSQQILLNSPIVDLGQAPVKSTSKSHLDFTNICSKNIRWLLTSFAPAYVKDNEPNGNLYRSSYAAFVFSHTSGLLEPGAKVRIPVSFNPMSEGSYSQFWDLEHHEATDSAAMSLNKVRIQLIGQGIKSNRPSSQMSSFGNVNKPKSESGIYVSEDTVKFSDVAVGDSTIVKIPVKNRSKDSHSVRFINVRSPFHITHQRHTIRPMSYACLPVTFKPTSQGDFEGSLVIQTEGPHSLTVKLNGSGV